MDPHDTGYFEYDDNYPPMCIKLNSGFNPSTINKIDNEIIAYLQDSYRTGLKHDHAILSCGLSAGEAGVLYFRKLNNKRRKLDKIDINVEKMIYNISESLERHMDINLHSHQ